MDDSASPGSEPGESEDPFNKINIVYAKEGKIVESSVRPIPPEAFSQEPFERKKVSDSEEAPPLDEDQPPEKIHPRLREWIDSRSGDETELILISFQDDLQLPRFPEPGDPTRDLEAYQNAVLRAEELIQQIKDRRADSYEKLARDLESSY